MSWRDDIEQGLEAFASVAALAGSPLPAVYGFWGDGCWLKVGMAGAKSQARFCSQLYRAGSAPSTLAGSLLIDPRMAAVAGFDATDAGMWIRSATHRVNILLPSSQPRELVALLEAFLHLRLRPRYER